MNIFRIHPDPNVSAELLMQHDPKRGRKQLLECCQIIASSERLHRGDTAMLKANGTPYGLTHPHHPCVSYCKISKLQRNITIETALCLAYLNPAHACSKSLRAWIRDRTAGLSAENISPNIVVVRKNHEHRFVSTVEQYAALMLAYLRDTKGFPA